MKKTHNLALRIVGHRLFLPPYFPSRDPRFFYLVFVSFYRVLISSSVVARSVLLSSGSFSRETGGGWNRFVISRPRLKSFIRPTVKRDIRGIIRCLSCFLPSSTESEVSAPRSKEFPMLHLLALVLIYRWIIVYRV